MAVLAAIAGLLYAIAFILLRDPLLSSLFLMLVGAFSTAAVVAIYLRVRPANPAFALWGLGIGFVGAVGTCLHGGYDLAYNLNPPSTTPPAPVLALPSQVDPRGLLTFGAMGVALFVLSWLIVRSSAFPRAIGYLGLLSAVLLVILYWGRLVVLDPANPIVLLPALLNGFIVSPLFYLGIGVSLLQRTATAPTWNGPERRRTARAS
jgi:hypothetical protein